MSDIDRKLIPNSGKRVFISGINQGGIVANDKFPLPEKFFLYVDSFQPSYSNNYSTPLQDISNAFKQTVVGKIANGLAQLKDAGAAFSPGQNQQSNSSGQQQIVTKKISFSSPNVRAISTYTNIKAWKDTTPIRFSLTFNFNWGLFDEYDARKEVINPIMRLMILGAPSNLDGMLMGPMPTSAWYWGQVINNVVNNKNGQATFNGSVGTINASETAKYYSKNLKDGTFTEIDKATYDAGIREIVNIVGSTNKEAAQNVQKIYYTGKEVDDSVNKQLADKTEKTFLDKLLSYESKIYNKIVDGINQDQAGNPNGSKALVNIQVGNVFSGMVTIMSANYNLNMENVDENGYPMEGSVTLECESVGMANDKDLTAIFK